MTINEIVYVNGDDKSLYEVIGIRDDGEYKLVEIGSNITTYCSKSNIRHVCDMSYNGRTTIHDIPHILLNDFSSSNATELLAPLVLAYANFSTHSMNDSSLIYYGEKNMIGAIIKMLLNNVDGGFYGVLPTLAQAIYDKQKEEK